MYLKSPKEGGKKQNQILLSFCGMYIIDHLQSRCSPLYSNNDMFEHFLPGYIFIQMCYMYMLHVHVCLSCSDLIAFNCILFYLQNYVLKYFVADTSIQKYSYNSETNTNQYDLRIQISCSFPRHFLPNQLLLCVFLVFFL